MSKSILRVEYMDPIREALGIPKAALEPQERVDVVRKGLKITLPENMTTDEAIDALCRKRQEEESIVAIHHVIPWVTIYLTHQPLSPAIEPV